MARTLPARQQETWREMEDGESLEARVVKAADKIQMMTKALVYGRQRRGDLHEFWKNDKNFRDRELAVAKECFALLQARHASGEWELGRW